MGHIIKKKRIGAVYSMTNTAPENVIVALRRNKGGRLSFLDSYSTGGSGSGEQVIDPLASQGSVILSRDGRLLFAVNAGSDSISSFHVSCSGRLTLVDVESSGGTRPNSLAVHCDLLYVTNAGDPGNNIDSNVTGFRVNDNGSLSPIIGSTEPLSSPDAQPACVVFSPHGKEIVVSERNTNLLSVYLVNADGTLNGPITNKSSGAGPFGSVFLHRGILLVAEVGPNALSSYEAEPNGVLDVISGTVLNYQTATCWVSAARNERFAFTSNTGSHTITTYEVEKNGELEVEDIVYSTWKALGAPIDNGVSRDGRNFYALNGNTGSISVFRIGRDGELIRLQVFKNTGLPEIGAQGLAVR